MIYVVNTIDKCNYFLKKFRDNGWKVWQMQYSWSDKEGFHAWFCHPHKDDIELVTYNRDVEMAIIKFNSTQK